VSIPSIKYIQSQYHNSTFPFAPSTSESANAASRNSYIYEAGKARDDWKVFCLGYDPQRPAIIEGRTPFNRACAPDDGLTSLIHGRSWHDDGTTLPLFENPEKCPPNLVLLVLTPPAFDDAPFPL
jgi:hypothetical protein